MTVNEGNDDKELVETCVETFEGVRTLPSRWYVVNTRHATTASCAKNMASLTALRVVALNSARISSARTLGK